MSCLSNIRDVTVRQCDGNGNIKNNNRFSGQKNDFASAPQFFVHFFAVFARLQREIAKLYFLGRT